MTNEPHFSKAADNNKVHILQQLASALPNNASILEIASGTAQHAIHFSKANPNWLWQPSDRNLNEYQLAETIIATGQENLLAPMKLDLANWQNFPTKYDAVYSANCLHIIPENLLKPYVEGASKSLNANGIMCLYGPFKYGGKFTTESNANFNDWLAENYPGGGIRDFEAIDALAKSNDLTFQKDVAMPANNQFITWIKS